MTVFRPNRWDNPKDRMVQIITNKIKKKRLVGNEGEVDLYFLPEKNRYFSSPNDYNPLEMRQGTATVVPDEEFSDIPF